MPGTTAAADKAEERVAPKGDPKEHELLQRMVGTFQAVRFRRQDNPWLSQRMGKVIEEARLFMRYPSIPLWPPRMLIRRIMRTVLAPMFEAQIDFNEAVRDVLIELRKRNESLAAAHEEALKTVATLEMEVDSLKMRLDETESERGHMAAVYSHNNGNGSHVGASVTPRR